MSRRCPPFTDILVASECRATVSRAKALLATEANDEAFLLFFTEADGGRVDDDRVDDPLGGTEIELVVT